MPIQEPKYYRARIKALTAPSSTTEIDENEKFFRNGFIPTEQQMRIESSINHFITSESNEPLKFEEITSFSTWFDMHPEKIAGKEIATTSRAFPIKVKGTKKDIETLIERALITSDESDVNALSLVKIKAKAAKAKLALLNIDETKQLDGIVSDFNQSIKRFFASKKTNDKYYSLGKPKAILIQSGISDKEIILYKSQLSEKVKSHNLTFQELKNLPSRINNPIFIFEAERIAGAYNIFFERFNNEGLMMCSIHDNKRKLNNIEVLEIKTIHGRRCKQITGWIEKGLLKYRTDIHKIKKLFSDSGFNCPQSEQLFNYLKQR